MKLRLASFLRSLAARLDPPAAPRPVGWEYASFSPATTAVSGTVVWTVGT